MSVVKVGFVSGKIIFWKIVKWLVLFMNVVFFSFFGIFMNVWCNKNVLKMLNSVGIIKLVYEFN